jgi:hypothetical protein
MLDEGASLEVRWILPGALTSSMIGWFGPFPGEIESREDLYLVSPGVRGVSLKIRGGARLDLKVAGGDQGVLDVARRARGTIGSWHKWSFPLSSVLETRVQSLEWIPVQKVRRIRLFSLVDGMPVELMHPGYGGSGCAVELTDVSIGDEHLWTLGLEANGRPDEIRGAIDAAATLLFRESLPDGRELAAADSMSYIDRLLSRGPGAGS